MIRSMTGYGRGELKTEEVQCIVEIKTVNHRYSDFTIKMPRALLPLEDRIRSLLKGAVSRGKADVFVTYTDLALSSRKVSVDQELVSAYFTAMEQAAKQLNCPFQRDLSMIFKIPDAFSIQEVDADLEAVWSVLQRVLEEALQSLRSMRETEGEKLRGELERILKNCQEYFTNILKRSPIVPMEYKEKLKKRIAELLEDSALDEQRIAAEVALFADHCSIDEELARFDSHIFQFRTVLSGEAAVGRKLDFIVQEMNREINTMGSKANDIEITNNVIALKSEIEKLREQIQNLE